jgi:ubiquitin C-terminal hydrolase
MNNCYLYSVIEALKSLHQFYSMKHNYLQGDIFRAFMSLYFHSGVNNVNNFKQLLATKDPDFFGNNNQQDAQEALIKILDFFGPTIMNQYMGVSKSTIECCNCGYECSSTAELIDLSVNCLKSDYSNIRTVSDCIAAYFKPEMISDAICEKCSNRGMMKLETIEKYPSFLIITLKKYDNARNTVSVCKTINFEKESGDKCTYYLTSVINHYGHNQFGHYTVDTIRDSKWVNIDEERVSQTMEPTNSYTAYVLIYNK